MDQGIHSRAIWKGKERKVTLHCDNQSALYLMRNPVHHERTKHTDIKYHFIREVISSGKVEAVIQSS